MSKKLIPAFVLTSVLAGLMTTQVNAAEVIRHKLPNSDFPISLAVEIPPGVTVVNLSGVVPPIAESLGLSMGDVIKMQVYLVGTPETGKMDFAGFMKGYTQFFGTQAQPKLPTRSAFQVAGLANPNYLVEIEVTAARP